MTTRTRSPKVVPISNSDAKLPPDLQLVLRRIRLLAKRRTEWLRTLWAQEGEPGGKHSITNAEMDAALEHRDAPAAELVWQHSNATRTTGELRLIEKALATQRNSRLSLITQTFALRPEDCDLLQLCAAVAIDASLARICAYLHDNATRPYVTEELAARLFEHGRLGLWHGNSPLARWALIESRDLGPGEPAALICDLQVRNWLLGQDAVDPVLSSAAKVCPVLEPLSSWRLDRDTQFAKEVIGTTGNGRVRFIVTGAPGSGRRSYAAALSSQIGLSLLTIDADQFADADWQRVFVRAQRTAYLGPYALAWMGESSSRRHWPTTVPLFPLQFVIGDANQEAPAPADTVDREINLAGLDSQHRASLWRALLPESSEWDKREFTRLVDRYHVQVGDIAGAAKQKVQSANEAALCIRQHARPRLGDSAQLLRCPFKWDDLVLSTEIQDVLRDIVFEAANRLVFWEKPDARRLFPQGQGLIALFTGPPGTGKTMSAQVIAAGLGYDLFRIDLAAVVSKYVGETSKNLRRILSRAAEMDIVLLFDEADALFSKRSSEIRDAQDKFANTDTAYLLQAIEAYPGIALLATNQKGNIDPAFIRRLRYVVEFSKPDRAQRFEIWRQIVCGLAGEGRGTALEPELKMLAETIDATGAQIKYAVLGAVFIAQREAKDLSISHLFKGLERELAKEGRTLGTRHRERMQRP
jgi:hypothetical protein